MTLRSTHTFAILEVSAQTYDEIRGKLQDANYHHAFVDDAIDMHGIGLAPSDDSPGPTSILREQFKKPGHRLELGRPQDGGSMTAVYEVYPDGDRTLWARFYSSSDAESIVAAINSACGNSPAASS